MILQVLHADFYEAAIKAMSTDLTAIACVWFVFRRIENYRIIDLFFHPCTVASMYHCF